MMDIMVQVMWHREARDIAFCVATRATMGDLVSAEQMDDLTVLYDDIKVTGALVRSYTRLGLSVTRAADARLRRSARSFDTQRL